MTTGRWGALLGIGLWALSAQGQEYRIGQPSEQVSSPVHLTLPAEVSNLPAVQDVRLVGTALESPVEVRGEVGIRVGAPLPVQVTNAPQLPAALRVEGPVQVQVDDSQPVRVWVENAPPPERTGGSAKPSYVVYFVQGVFSSKDTRVRRAYRPPEGAVFHLTDLAVDARPDVNLRVRVLAAPAAVGGRLVGAEGVAEVPLAGLDTRLGISTRLGTPAPLASEFTVEVEALGPGQGAPFRVIASGFLVPRGEGER